MKRIFILYILCLWYGCSDPSENEILTMSVTVDAPEVPNVIVELGDKLLSKMRNGDVYLNDIPFSGYLISRYSNDSIYLIKGYVEGKQSGLTTAYYEDGAIQYERPYLKGEKHGIHIGYHQNGQKGFEYYFENGFNEGNHLEWYSDGKKATDMNYVNGKEFGKQQAWRPDGKLRSNYIVRENGRMYGLQGIKRCTKLDGVTKTIDPYKGQAE
jgi:antitoxin component YwqK of YwqJK toxin-antitoxin module